METIDTKKSGSKAVKSVTRRGLLKHSAGVALAAPIMQSNFLHAQTPAGARLIFLSLRGGLDGLSLLVPHGDRDYYRVRGGLAFPPPWTSNGPIELNELFGLNEAAEAFIHLWENKHICFLPACGDLRHAAIHSRARLLLETGSYGDFSTSWLERAVRRFSDPSKDARLDILGEMRREAPEVGAAGVPGRTLGMERKAELLYRDSPQLQDHLRLSQQFRDRGQARLTEDDRGADGTDFIYPEDLSIHVRNIVSLIEREDGPRVVQIALGGFDTHLEQGIYNGLLPRRIGALAEAFAAFRDHMDREIWSRTVIVAASEFGRTVFSNDFGGTGHGFGGLVIVAGGVVNGGRILGGWPGLSDDRLYAGVGIQPRIDARTVLGGLLVDHLRIPSDVVNQEVFPDVPWSEYYYGLVA